MNKLVNIDLNDEQLELANWFITEVGELRQFGGELLAFLWPSQLEDLKGLLVDIDDDYFTDGTMKLEYNGTDLVLDISSILKFDLNGIDPTLIYPEWKKS